MRIDEIASAEEQIALFKLVSDNVWQALATQQKQQADERAAKQAAAKTQPKKSLRSKLAMPAPQLPIPKPAKTKPQQQPQQKKVVQKPQPAPQSFVAKPPVPTQNTAVTTAALNNWQNGRLV